MRMAITVLALGVAFLGLANELVAAPEPEAARVPTASPDGGHTGASFGAVLTKGNAKALAREWSEAAEFYRQATEVDPKNPLGHYLLGEALLAGGKVADAEAALMLAQTLSGERDANLRGRVLFAVADLRERQKKIEDARLAWRAYAEFAETHENVTYASSAASRLQAVEEWLKLAKAYEGVRERIAAERDAGAVNTAPKDAGAKAAPAKKK